MALAASNAFVTGLPSAVPNNSIVSMDQVVACYSSFNIDSETKKDQIDTLKRYFELYPYTDIAQNSSAPYYPSSVNIFSALDAIAADSSITTEFEFQSAIQYAVYSLNDAHTYYSPNCFTTARLLQPFIIDVKPSDSATSANNVTSASGPLTVYIRDTLYNGALFTGSRTQLFADSISSALKSFWNTSVNGDASKYVNFTVTLINKQPALAFIQRYADRSTGFSHVPETRFNTVMPASVYESTFPTKFLLFEGTLVRSRTVFFDSPTSLEYQLSGPEGQTVTLNVPYASYIKSDASVAFTDRDSYYQNNCVDPSASRRTPEIPLTNNNRKGSKINDSNNTSDSNQINNSNNSSILFASLNSKVSTQGFHEGGAKFDHFIPSTLGYSVNPDPNDILVAFHAALDSDSTKQYIFNSKTSSFAATSNLLSSTASPLVADKFNAFYMLDSTTGVWLFTTVDPTQTDDKSVASFVGTVTAGLVALEKAGASKLLIDTSGNRGGVICIGYFFLQYILKNPILLPYDVRLSASMTMLVENADNTRELRNLNTVFSQQGLIPGRGGDSILMYPRNLTRGGASSLYSDTFSLACTSFATQLSQTVPPLTKGWSPTSIFIISDGTCGSTCAAFTRIARDQFQVRSFTYGGSTGEAFQPSSFEGGTVASFERILNDTRAIVNAVNGTRNSSLLSSLGGSDTSIGRLPNKRFALPVMGSVLLWESYSEQGKGELEMPVEWIPAPSEGYLAGVYAVDKIGVWRAAAEMAGNPENTGSGIVSNNTEGNRGWKTSGCGGNWTGSLVVDVCISMIVAIWLNVNFL